MAGLVLILRPYKKTSHNMIDFLTLFLMTLFAALSVTGTLSVYILFGPLHLPFLCLVGYLIYRMFKYCSCCCACVTQNVYKSSTDDENNPSAPPSEVLQPLIPPTTTEVELDDYVEDDLYPDRIVNPGGYT